MIYFFTENSHVGLVPRNYHNMRTEFAWMCATGAYHVPFDIAQKMSFEDHCDLGIVILPKSKPVSRQTWEKLRKQCDKLAIMQEGPNWYFQDSPVADQLEYLRRLDECDFILAHNPNDADYFNGLVDKNTYVLRSLMIEDAIPEGQIYTRDHERENSVLINGNCTSWYGGIDSYVIAKHLGAEIYMPTMGRRQKDENLLGVKHIPYVMWGDWIKIFSMFRYAVNCMRTYAAGTFSLNAAYLGIPCFGYSGSFTQKLCFPYLTVDEGNLWEMKNRISEMKDVPSLYHDVAKEARQAYFDYFHEDVFMRLFRGILKEEKVGT